jgi:hypothetical protein
MQGKLPYSGTIVPLFLNMDRRVGGDFEAGLANLKALVETQGQSR